MRQVMGSAPDIFLDLKTARDFFSQSTAGAKNVPSSSYAVPNLVLVVRNSVHSSMPYLGRH